MYLSKQEKEQIVECLLFSACTDICGNWEEEHFKDMMEIAKKLYYSNADQEVSADSAPLNLSNIEITSGTQDEPEKAKEIELFFKVKVTQV